MMYNLPAAIFPAGRPERENRIARTSTSGYGIGCVGCGEGGHAMFTTPNQAANPMTPEAASRIQSASKEPAKADSFPARAQRAAAHNGKAGNRQGGKR